jgi:hypothetical protein
MTAAQLTGTTSRPDHLTGTARASAVDRWIYVFTAASFVLVALVGFIPDSLEKVALVEAGGRPAFPLVLHLHAVLMGSYLLLLLAQTVLMATGRADHHRRLGLAAIVLGPALVVVGFILVPTIYHLNWNAAQTAQPDVQAALQQRLLRSENIMLLQTRIGVLFPLLLLIGLLARKTNPGLHKRMMILSVAVAMPAAFDRITWIPHTLPLSPISPDLYVLLAIAPMFIWDVIRNRGVHQAYWIWLAAVLPLTVAVHALWDTPWWHATAHQLMGV